MIASKSIKNLSALFLLIVCCISAAPKAYFHDLVSDHKDVPSCNLPHDTTAVHHLGFNCHFDELVTATPFFLQAGQSVNPPYNFQDLKVQSLVVFYIAADIKTPENRGPPTL